MPKLEMSVKIPKLDATSWAKTTEKQLHELMVGAARAFLVAALRRIPVRTGFLAGAFGTLEDAIGAAFTGEGEQHRSIGKNKGTIFRNTEERNRQLRNLKRLEKLRTHQRARFKELEELRFRELHRRTEIQKRFSELHAEQPTKLTSQHKQNELLGKIRSEALKDRARRLSLLNEIRKTRDQIGKLGATVEKQFNPERFKQLERINKTRLSEGKKVLSHGLEQEDHLTKLRARIEHIHVLRDQRFQTFIQNLGKRLEGGQISKVAHGKLLENARAKISNPNRTIISLQQRLNNLILKRASKLNQTKIKKLAAKLERQATRRLELKAGLTSKEIESEARNIAFRSLSERLTKLSRRSQFQAQIAQANTKKGFELLQQFANSKTKLAREEQNTRLNTLARVSSTQHIRDSNGNIIGSRRISRIRRLDDIRQGENVLALLNRKRTFTDKNGREKTVTDNVFREFYYPVKGDRAGRVLKTPRSGRRFATPATGVVIGLPATQVGGKEAQLFNFLQGQLQAAGIPAGQITINGQKTFNPTLAANINAHANALKNLPTVWVFHYAVNISYLAANETARGAWLAWTSAIFAARQYVAANAFKIIPNLEDYVTYDTLSLKDTTIRRG